MKNRFVLIALFVAFSLPATTHASDADWTVQVDPLTTALGFVHIQVERTIGDRFSIYAGPSLRLFSNPATDAEDFIGLGAELGLRWYFLGGAPEGWWAMVRGVGAQLSTSARGVDETSFGGYVSSLGGYTWIFSDWFVLSAGTGVQYFAYEIAGLGISGVLPALHTTFGAAF